MFKLIMFIEKIKHLYSRVEIKTLKQGKTMISYQTLKVYLNPKLTTISHVAPTHKPATPSPFVSF